MRYLPEHCDCCGVCVAVCPPGAVLLVDASVVFLDSCTCCEICAEACPAGAILQDDERFYDRWNSPGDLSGVA